MKKILILITIVFSYGILAFSANVSSVKSGNWNDPTVWNTGTVPVDGDNISLGHLVTVNQTYDYSSGSITINWSGSINILSGFEMDILNISSSNGGAVANQFDGTLNVGNDFDQNGGDVNIGTNGKIITTGTYTTGGGSATELEVTGLLEVGALTNGGSAQITVASTGEIIVHGDYTNTSGADITINGGEMTIEAAYRNSGNGSFTLNDGGTLHIMTDFVNTGGSEIVINDGYVIIDGNVENRGGSDFDIADGSYVEVNGDFTNTGGGDVTVDGSLDIDGTLTNSGGGDIDGTGSLSAGTIVDPHNRINPGLLIPKTLYSIGDGSWLNNTIWSYTNGGTSCNCTPPINSIVTISSGDNVYLNSKIKINTLTIENNAELELMPKTKLTMINSITINGKMILENDATNSASFVDNGTINYGVNAKITTKISTFGNAYHYISSSIPNISVDSIHYIGDYYNANVYQYDETAADHWGTPNDDDGSNDYIGWISPSATLVSAEGFSVYTPGDYTFSLTGTSINTGSFSTNITYTNHASLPDNSTYDGWNLIGNPYPSGLNAQSFIGDNNVITTGNVYIWDDDNSDGTNYSSLDYIQVNSAGTVTNSQKGSTFNGIIAPNQAFFVQAVSDGAVNFDNSQRDGSSTTIFKSAIVKAEPIQNEINKFKLSLKSKNTILYNETLLAFAPNASDKFDNGYDGVKRKGNANIAFYSLMNGEEMGIQTFSNEISEKEIYLGFETQVADEYTISIKDSKLMDNFDIYLFDKYNSTTINLKQQDYTFSSSVGIFNSRFIIKINKKFAPSIKPKNDAELLNIYSNNSNINILNNSTDQINDAIFTLIDLQGRIIYQQKFDLLNGQTITIPVDTQEGIFISTVKYGAKIITKKIYIK